MKIVGRQALATAEVTPLAKKRLALWIKEVGEARWTTVDAVKATHPELVLVGDNRLLFLFRAIAVELEAIACLDLGIIYIDRVAEMEDKRDE